MKKLLSVILSVLMITACMVPAFSVSAAAENYPIIVLRGDGTQIYVPDETAPNGERNIWGDAFTNIEGSSVTESIANVLLPFLTEGLLFNKWENYYDAFYEEIAPIFEELRLDGDGKPRYNSGLGKDDLNNNANTRKVNYVNWDGTYNLGSYTYRYDWRLSPFDVVDDLDGYIRDIMTKTGKKKVNLVANCLGGSYILAYLSYVLEDLKEPDENGNPKTCHINNVFFNATVGNGTDVLTDAFCGDIEINAKGIQRFAYQSTNLDNGGLFGFIQLSDMMSEIVFTSYDLLTQTGVVDALGLTFDDLYQRIYEGLVPHLAIAIFGTMPGYWTAVESERYEEARNFIFGKEGDEFYDEYAGVVAKNDLYYEKVSSKIYDIIAECQAKGVRFGANVKYGVQMYPFVKSQNKLSDEMVDLENASFGATTAKDVFSKFSDEYMENAKVNGTDKYISPDRQVDVSTSIFKDTLWVQKNVNHNRWVMDDQIALQFCRSNDFDVNSDPRYPQFMIYIPGTMQWDEEEGEYDTDTGDIVPMTAENCELTLWDDMPDDSKKEPTIISRLMAFFRWLTTMLKFITGKLTEKPVADVQ